MSDNGITVNESGQVFSITADGLPARRNPAAVVLPKDQESIVFVNGFNFDPTENGEDNPHQGLFREWRRSLLNEGVAGDSIFNFGWYSGELEVSSWLGGLVRGRWNSYRWGWDLAEQAGGILARMLGYERDRHPKATIISHSLGTRVTLEALKQVRPDRVSKVILLNGAEYSQTASVIAKHTAADVLNVKVETDDVLNHLGETFAPERFMADVVGRHGLSLPHEPNWTEIQFDSRDHQAKARDAGFPDIQGDDPKMLLGDHWYSYKHAPNWKLFAAFLNDTSEFDRLKQSLRPLVG